MGGGAAGGVFKLIANDGKQDRLLMATSLLNARIKDVMCARSKAGQRDITPTLADLERTHVLFMNAHFKPFAAIGYEYNKVRPQSGTSQLGNTVTFSIPQFGDFFADIVVRTRLSAATTAAAVVPAVPAPPAGIDFVEWVDADGTTLAPGANYQDNVRYCEYPGVKLFTSVRFDVNGNPLDEYTDYCASFFRKYHVSHGKETGFNRLVGQEVPIKVVSGASTCPVTNPDGGAALAADTSRAYKKVVNGLQTPKPAHGVTDLWTPLLLWFNKDVRLAVPSVSIPYGQRFITIAMEAQNRMVFATPGLFLKQVVDDGANVRNVTFIPKTDAAAGGLPLSAVNSMSVDQMEMYINNIFVNPEVHDIYIKRIGFSLIRVHRFQRQQLTAATGEVQLTQLKWPIEYIFACLQPTFNTDLTNNSNVWRDWHRCGKQNIAACPDIKYKSEEPSGAVGAVVSYTEGSVVPDTYPVPQATIDTLSVLAHGICLYDTFNSRFYSDYLPYHYGGLNIRTPDDDHSLMINFALYPGTYQPSGHTNLSRAREFYLNYVSTYASAGTPVDLLVCASALNFLLISDGSAVLRYAT